MRETVNNAEQGRLLRVCSEIDLSSFQLTIPALKDRSIIRTVATGRAWSLAPTGATESSPVLQCRDRGLNEPFQHYSLIR
jgi:hypothetical protein